MSAAVEERYHGLDWLRAVAMLLGIWLHAALSFMETPIGWVVRDMNRSLFFDVSVAAIHGFRMQLFFLLAGFFGRLVYQRYGAKGFFRHRFTRIGLPFVVGMATLVPLIGFLWMLAAAGSTTELLRRAGEHPGQLKLAPAHLWFLYYLLIFYTATLVAAAVFRMGRFRVAPAVRNFITRLFKSRAAVFWFALPTLAIVSSSPIWMDVEMAGASFIPHPRALAYYGLFYAIGWLLHGQRDLLHHLTERFQGLFFLAFITLVLALGCVMHQDDLTHPRYNVLRFGCMSFFALYSWSMVFASIGLVLRYFHQPRPAFRYLADSSYWCYLAHLPPVIYLQMKFQYLPWPAAVKFILLNAITVALLLATYHFCVRYTLIGVVLHGRRTRCKEVGGLTTRKGASGPLLQVDEA